MQPLIISYLRFSSTEQRKGSSQARQIELREGWLTRHGLKLTENIEDLGVSAFRGKNLKSGLANFLDLVQKKMIPTGSVLLVEELDRLTRQSADKALKLFLDIVDAGVKIVTLNGFEESDIGVFEKGKIDQGKMMIAVVKFCTAYDESKKKSFRSNKNWDKKRSLAAVKPMTARIPAWLKIQNGKIVVDEPKAQIIKQIFKDAINGMGLTAITKNLNKTGVPNVGTKNGWHCSYVNRILHSRAVLGEFQNHQIKHDEDGTKNRQPIGEPLDNYFPSIVSETDYYAAQQAMSARKTVRGPHGKFVNVLSSLLFCAEDQSAIIMQNKDGHRRYASSAAVRGIRGHAPYVGFPVSVLENEVIGALAEPTIYCDKSRAIDLQLEISAADGRVKDTLSKIAKVENSLASGEVDHEVVMGLLTKLNKQQKAQKLRVEELKGTQASASQNDTIEQMMRFIELKKDGKLSALERFRVRSVMQRLVERIDCSLTRVDKQYRCEATIHLKDGSTLPLTVNAWRNGKGWDSECEEDYALPAKEVAAVSK